MLRGSSLLQDLRTAERTYCDCGRGGRGGGNEMPGGREERGEVSGESPVSGNEWDRQVESDWCFSWLWRSLQILVCTFS